MRLAIILLAFPLLTNASEHLHHMDLEMSSGEYALVLKTIPKSIKSDPEVETAIKLGIRLQQWIAKINTARSPETLQIRLFA